ncbi:MAG TPA: diversity-generating retroelement protein bAvd family protein [Holosporales bacterium]|nr:diversity-generating retroelement protein bAvd family protein [Holosporales bacterium]
MRNFRNLDIWKSGFDLVKQIYNVTKGFPSSEMYGLTSQMRRASVSLPSNIAEGASRRTNTDFARFLEIALGSSFELETQLMLSMELDYLKAEDFEKIITNLNSLQKQINSLLTKVRGD